MGMDFDTIILGATFYGAAAALSLPGRTLLVESGGAVGDDFVASLNLKPPAPIRPESARGMRYFKELERRGAALAGGEVYLAPAAYLLSKELMDAAIPLALLSTVICARPCRGGYRLTLSQPDGLRTLTARRVVDTTPLGTPMRTDGAKGIHQSLRLVLEGARGRLPEGALHQALSGLTVLPLTLSPSDGWLEARDRLRKFGDGEFKRTGGRVAFVATCFAYHRPAIRMEMQKGWFFAPSCAWNNPAEAFDQGVMAAEGGSFLCC